MPSEAKIERTPDAKRLQLKSWTQTCGSRHSRKHDAEHHWDAKHGEGAKKK